VSTARRARRPRRRTTLASCLSLIGALLASGCDRAPGPGMLESSRALGSGDVVVEFDLSRGLLENNSEVSFLQRSSAPTLPGLVTAVERVKKDERSKGVYVRFGTADFNWAHAEEVGSLFAGLRGSRPVVCHAHGFSNASLWLALRACDRVWLSPAGEVGTVGIAGQMVYLKGLLDRLKVRTDFLHMGRYKSAAETLTRDGPSDEARESLLSVLRSIRTTWLDGLKEARAGERVTFAAEHGPWSPEAALEHGVVDQIGYESEARDDAKARAKVDAVQSSFGVEARRDAAKELAEVIRLLSGAQDRRGSGERVVVLPAEGSIDMASGGPFSEGGIAAKSLTRVLKRLREDDNVKAVVLRIESPGGSALASDLIWHELMQLREKKPLIASLASVAASGGYYLACAAHRIVAEPTSIVGSIGVVGGKIALGEAFAELGVNGVTFAASEEPGAGSRAAYLSALTTWDEPTRERVQAQMQSVYELFLARVSKGRNMPVDQIRSIAEGRIWSGVQGKENGLVDELGGLSLAVSLAKQRANLDADATVQVEGAPEGLLDLLEIDETSDESTIRAALARFHAQGPSPLEQLPAPLRAYAASVLPLIEGEHVLATMPFAVTIE
jgi:protease-4